MSDLLNLLMCKPQHFGVKYVNNPWGWWVDHIHGVDKNLASQQWQAFYDHLNRYAKIELINPQPHLPNFFTANAGLVHNTIYSKPFS